MNHSLIKSLRLYGWPLIFAVATLATGAFYWNRTPDWDEPYYMDLIVAIRNLIEAGQLHQIFAIYLTPKFSGITSLPLYFIILGYLKLLSDFVPVFRAPNVILMFCSTLIFVRCRKKINPLHPELNGLGFLLFPVTLTLSLLIYNDYTALFMVLCAYWLETKGRSLTSAAVLFIGFFIRQSIAPWFVLVPIFATLSRPDESLGIVPAIHMTLRRPATLFLIFCVCVFVFLNHGFSMGDKVAQASGHFSIGNLINFYFFSGLFFLPSFLAHAKSHSLPMMRSPILSAWGLVTVASALVIHVNADLHPYNTWLDHKGTVFIRNWVVHLQREELAFQILSFFCVCFGLLELNYQLPRKLVFWLSLGVVVSLAPFKVIDIRYSIIPMTFYLLFRRSEVGKLEVIQISWQIMLSLTWLAGVKFYLWTPF